MVEAGGVGIFRVLKTQNLLKTRDAQNAGSAGIALNWSVSGTRSFDQFRQSLVWKWYEDGA